MGLDGISTNQLRLSSEANSNELNSVNFADTNPQTINGLAKGQRINPDDKNEKNPKNDSKENEEENFEEDDKENNPEESIKYDLSDSKKYILKVDEKTNSVLIIEKETQKIIQTFNPESLSNLTKYLDNYRGVLINRKY